MRQERALQQSDNGKQFGCYKHAKRTLEDFRVQNNLCSTIGWCIRKPSWQIHRNMQAWFYILLLRCQKLVWMDDVAKAVRKWFRLEKRQVYIRWRFMQNYNKDSGKGYILEFGVKCTKELQQYTQWSAILTRKNDD